MKISPFSLLVLLCHSVFSQGSYIQTKSGSKIDFLKNSIQVVVQDRTVSFKTVGGGTKEIAFKDIDVAYFGTFKFKSFKFTENKNGYCYFVLAESPKFTLISLGIPDSESEDDAVSVRINYEVYVLDKQNAVVDMVLFNNQKNDRGTKSRSGVQDIINRNFPNCQVLMDRFVEFEKLNQAQFMGLLGFFNQPSFVSCP